MNDLKYIYVSGPMTGKKNGNHSAFNKATAKLRSAGYFVISPVELDGPKTKLSYSECLRRDIAVISTKCWAIATLPGHKKSNGATLETYNAKEFKMPIHPVQYWLDI